MVWLSGDFSSTQTKRSGWPTCSLMSSNGIDWACAWLSRKSRQLIWGSAWMNQNRVILWRVRANYT